MSQKTQKKRKQKIPCFNRRNQKDSNKITYPLYVEPRKNQIYSTSQVLFLLQNYAQYHRRDLKDRHLYILFWIFFYPHFSLIMRYTQFG
jgi:hypothetical protein